MQQGSNARDVRAGFLNALLLALIAGDRRERRFRHELPQFGRPEP